MARGRPPVSAAADPERPVTPDEVAQALAAIESSATFRPSRRHRVLLRHLVARAQAGSAASLKESVIAVEVFGRPADRFDPREDSIVRVECRRLRARLACYHAGEGRNAPLRIELPVGSYVPALTRRAPAGGAAAASRRARDLTERGDHFLHLAMTRDNLEAAVARFDAALREAPGHAPACVGLARAWFNLAATWHRDARVAGELATEALRRGLALDPGDAAGWALLGAVQHQIGHDWPAARRSLARAVRLAPRAAFVRTVHGCQRLYRGEFDVAEHELLLARELDPQYLNSRLHMANLRMAQQRYADAAREAEALQDLAPNSLGAIGARASLALLQGRADEALALYDRAQALAPGHAGVAVLRASALALAGRGAEADRIVATVQADQGDTLSPYVLALFETRRGRHDAAIAAIGQALDARDPQAVLFASDPTLAALHGHPGWTALRRRLGL